MQVTKVHVASRRGANKCPSGGDVTFDDGKSYGWGLHGLTNEIFFSTYRRIGGTNTHITFHSPKRAAALTTYLDKE